MTIPNYQELMQPLLRILAAAGEGFHQKECTRRVADALHLSEEDRLLMLPSGDSDYFEE